MGYKKPNVDWGPTYVANFVSNSSSNSFIVEPIERNRFDNPAYYSSSTYYNPVKEEKEAWF